MIKDIKKYWPTMKLTGLVIGIILVLDKFLIFFLPTILNVLIVSGSMKEKIARYLLATTLLLVYLGLRSILSKSSELKCPYCGSFKWFATGSDTENVPNLPKGYIRRFYECKNKKCKKKEKIYVKPLSVPLAKD